MCVPAAAPASSLPTAPSAKNNEAGAPDETALKIRSMETEIASLKAEIHVKRIYENACEPARQLYDTLEGSSLTALELSDVTAGRHL